MQGAKEDDEFPLKPSRFSWDYTHDPSIHLEGGPTTLSFGDWTFRLTRNTLQTLWSGLFSAVVAGGPLQYLQGLGQEALQSQAAFWGVREREYKHIYYLTIVARCFFICEKKIVVVVVVFLFSHEAFTCSFGPSQRPNCRENRWSISCQS